MTMKMWLLINVSLAVSLISPASGLNPLKVMNYLLMKLLPEWRLPYVPIFNIFYYDFENG